MTLSAETLTRIYWESRRDEVIAYLMERYFTKKAAMTTFDNFVETMAYVAAETGELGFKQR